MTPKAKLVVVALGCVVLAACGRTRDETLAGRVTSTSPRLCVGAPAAKGRCFDLAGVAGQRRSAVGDCIQVTFAAGGDASATTTATAVEPASSCRRPIQPHAPSGAVSG